MAIPPCKKILTTAIMLANMLIDAKADLNMKDKGGDTAPMKAADRDRKPCALLLLPCWG
ncbi:MAG: hypothetical protein U1F16_02155 [Turneriella sp.]